MTMITYKRSKLTASQLLMGRNALKVATEYLQKNDLYYLVNRRGEVIFPSERSLVTIKKGDIEDLS